MPTKPKPKTKAKAKAKAITTRVIFLLDRSGSMATVKDETISGINSYLKDLRADTKQYGKVQLTVVQFDSAGIDTLYKEADPADVPNWNADTFQPRGMTPLVDAMGRTISEADASQPHLFVTVTDGQENASHEWTSDKLKSLVEARTKSGWTFVYLGADHDAFSQAQSIGVSAQNTMQYNKANSQAMFATVSMGTRSYRGAGGQSIDNFAEAAAAQTGETEKQLRDKLTKGGK